MNEDKQAEERNLERLIQAGFDESVRPNAAARERAWKRVQAACQAGPATGAAPQAAAPAKRNVQSESQNNTNQESTTLMSLFLRNRWRLGFSAATFAAVAVAIALVAVPKAHATAAQMLARGAQAVARLSSIHLKGQLRTLPADNFSYINTDQDFHPIELWTQFEPALKWRVEKPGRVAVMNGQSTLLYIKTANTAYKIDHSSTSAFDTDWLHHIANLSHTISNELILATAHGWKLDLAQTTGSDGRLKVIVTVNAKSGIPDDDYAKNSFLQTADTRRVYQFDDKTELLESVQIFQVKNGTETQIFELSQIDYNQAIDETLWQLAMPANVSYYQEPQKLADNDRYAAMTPEEAARAFFDACSREDWIEAGKFMSPLPEGLKNYLGGLQIVSLGQSFGAQKYPGRLVPYEIKFQPQSFNVRVANTNAAKRFVLTGMYDAQLKLEQDLKWSAEPEVLPNNDAYAQLSPAQAVQAYFDAQAKLDWDEMRKFTSQYDVDKTRRELETAQKQGLDPKKIIPAFQVGEAVWSPEQSAFFVKCTMAAVKKHNLAIRKDNAAGRWQVDGGL